MPFPFVGKRKPRRHTSKSEFRASSLVLSTNAVSVSIERARFSKPTMSSGLSIFQTFVLAATLPFRQRFSKWFVWDSSRKATRAKGEQSVK